MNSFTVPTFIAPRFFSPFSIFFGKRKNYAAAEISQNRESIVSFFLLIFTEEEEELFDFLIDRCPSLARGQLYKSRIRTQLVISR